ncbi:hypothetical protein FRC07_005618 [Ceratobasidium sp. 392]|nr:hypothetical protein FRC07_005618 [Ceratobasidium sp. 392]
MAMNALDNAAKATEDNATFMEFCDIFTGADYLGNASDCTPGELAETLIAILWDDRDSFLTLAFDAEVPDPESLFVSSEDSRTIAQAYTGLLFVWQQDGLNTEDVPVDLMDNLTGVVAAMLTCSSAATIEELIQATRTSLGFLWLLLEHRGRTDTTERSQFMEYGLGSFKLVW